jgi:hypothetical protein
MVSTVKTGVQTMNKQSSQDRQNKAKPMKDQLSEQELNKASGGMEIGGFNGTPLQGPDTNGVPSPIVVPTHTDPFRKG